MEKSRFSQAGFSLVEIVVAMAILAIGLIGVAPMLAFNVKANAAGKNYAIASYLAQQRLEQIRAWPLYEDYSVNNPGITSNNTSLFNVESGIKVGEHYTSFNRTTELLHNGYSTGYDCTSGGFIFDNSGGDYNEGNTGGGGSLNTGEVGEKCASGNYRGEDFKLIKVTISWIDPLVGRRGTSTLQATHTITRYMYIAKF